MQLGWDDMHHGGGEIASDPRASSTRLGLSDMGGQIFSGIRNADHSRSHFGNVYNNIYPSVDQPKSDGSKARDLMEALAFKGMGDRLMTVSSACANTCTWILQTHEFTSWRDYAHRHANHGVLWIKGKAGTGKSTLMRYIYDYARKNFQEDTTISFFFNARSSETVEKSTEGMYRALLFQLYDRMPHLKMIAIRSTHVTEQQSWSVEVLEGLLREAILGLTAHEKVTCYLDALDECETDQVRSAVEFFESLSQSATSDGVRFYLCLSSRHYPHMPMRIHEEIILDVLPDHLRDIRTYLTNSLTIQSPSRADLRAEVEKRCSGVFLWVVLVVRMLKHEYGRGATASELRKTLNIVPDQLDALFAKMSESADDAFHVAMRWVLFTKRPLQPGELYFVIKTSMGELSSAYWNREEVGIATFHMSILHVSRGLIECTTGRLAQVQFIHESGEFYASARVMLQAAAHRDTCAIDHAGQSRILIPPAFDATPDLATCCGGRWGSPLHAAVYHGMEDCVQLLLDKGANVDLSGQLSVHGRVKAYVSPIMLATVYKNTSMVQLLLRRGASIIPPSPWCGFDTTHRDFPATIGARAFPQAGPLPSFSHVASLHGSGDFMPLARALARIEQLLSMDPDVTVSRSASTEDPLKGLTALHIAASEAHEKATDSIFDTLFDAGVLRTLLDAGTNVNITDARGRSALHFAVMIEWENFYSISWEETTDLHRILRASSMLLGAGADVNAADANGRTALHFAVLRRAYTLPGANHVLEILLEAGADINAVDLQGRTALHIVVSTNNYIYTNMLHALLEAGSNVDAIDAKGRTALMIAEFLGHLNVFRLLLSYGAKAH